MFRDSTIVPQYYDITYVSRQDYGLFPVVDPDAVDDERQITGCDKQTNVLGQFPQGDLSEGLVGDIAYIGTSPQQGGYSDKSDFHVCDSVRPQLRRSLTLRRFFGCSTRHTSIPSEQASAVPCCAADGGSYA